MIKLNSTWFTEICLFVVLAVLALIDLPQKINSCTVDSQNILATVIITMCVHKNTCPSATSLLDSTDLEDFEDNCDYETLNKSIENPDCDLSVLQLNIHGVSPQNKGN